MQPGSLVVYTHPYAYVDMITPDPTQIYTVRELINCLNAAIQIPHLGIYLEEITNGTVAFMLGNVGKELAYQASHFKEVQPPMRVLIEEIINEPQPA